MTSILLNRYLKVPLAKCIWFRRKKRDLYAAKVLGKVDMKRKNEMKKVEKEKNMAKLQVKNPFVVKLIYSFQSEKNLFLLMEYQPGGDLHSLLMNLEHWKRMLPNCMLVK